ncbi:MAG: nickel-dependent lactate racemase [Chloroflexi bacterium]|nr:nickel-dependent lactate racemase [Chloroflexota bacterium]
MAQEYTVPYSKAKITFRLLEGMDGTLVQSKYMPPLTGATLDGAIRNALEHPIASPRLRDLARPTDKVCIAVTDITRSCPDDKLLPPLLAELERAGVPDQNITILIAVGMHRASTVEERRVMLGEAIVARYAVRDHEPQNPEMLVDLGKVAWDVPAVTNKIAYEADLLLATGIVEPHQYAGFSGGRKTVAIGVAGEATIEYTHLPWALDHPKTRLGNLEGNPFHEAVTEIAQRVGLRFIINVVVDDDGNVVAVKAGHPIEAFHALVEVAKGLYVVPIEHDFDVVVAGVGYPKDANLYQASRAASYLVFAPEPVVRKGGIIIIPMRCEEGAGQGVGEKRFFERIKSATTMQEVLDEARRHGYKPGEQRAFVMAKVLEHCDVVIVGSDCPDEVAAAHMIPADDLHEALEICQQRLGQRLRVAVVPHALLTLPVIQREKALAR